MLLTGGFHTFGIYPAFQMQGPTLSVSIPFLPDFLTVAFSVIFDYDISDFLSFNGFPSWLHCNLYVNLVWGC